MTGKNVEVFERARWVIEIDHHRSRTPFGDVLLIDADAACAGELVYELLLELDVPITSDIAQNILTSLLVETNSFRLPGIRPRTFELCSELLKSGVDFYKLAESVYWVTTKETALLTGISLSRCCFSPTGEIAWTVLSRADFKKTGASDSDADSVSEKIRSIQGVKIAILFREKNSREWRVSLRSKDGINLTSLAEQFGGGGHISAAGCTIPKKQKTLCLLLKSAEELLKKHNSFKAQPPLTQTNRFSSVIPDECSKLSEAIFDQTINSNDNRLQNWMENKRTMPHFRKPVQSKLAS
jgi:phosphoesterase RecJ-like protein